MATESSWIRLLPPSDREQLLAELVEAAETCARVGEFSALVILLKQWRTTAEAWADPAVLAALTAPVLEDGLVVERPAPVG